MEVGGKVTVVKITQLYISDVGCVVWDAAVVLSKHFFPDNTTATATQPERDLGCGCEETLHVYTSGSEAMVAKSHWTGKRVVDLGSGTDYYYSSLEPTDDVTWRSVWDGRNIIHHT